MAFSGIVFAILGSVFSLWAVVRSSWSSVTTWLYAPFLLVYVLAGSPFGNGLTFAEACAWSLSRLPSERSLLVADFRHSFLARLAPSGF